MASFLDFEGVYDQSKRYMVNNWSDEDFTQHFGEESVYNDSRVITSKPAYDLTIKAGEMRELGQFEAYMVTRHFVNREMLKEAEKLTTPKERERAEMGIHNAILREPYEKKTIAEIKPGESTPFMDKLRAEIRREEIAKLAQEVTEEKPKVKQGRPAKVAEEFSE